MNPLDAFDRILALLHRAALEDVHWPAATARIDEAAGTVCNVLVVGEGTRRDVRVHHFSLLYRGEPAEDRAREYLESYQPIDEGPPRLRERPAGQVMHVSDLYTERELRTSQAYNEGWRRYQGRNGLITRIDGPDGLSIVWGVGDPVGKDGWQSAQVRLIASLVPHIRQFALVRQALAAADALGAGLAGLLDQSGIGVLRLDRGGRLLAVNDPAQNILRRSEGLSDRDGALHASLPADNSRLQKLLKRALPVFGSTAPPTGGSIRIQRPRLRSRLELHVHPIAAAQADFGGRRTAALVLVADPENRRRVDPVRVAALLGLTPSEARVAALLAEGRPVREIAAATGLKESYVRWLLKQIYKKQDISGQVALVQRVLSAHGLPRR